MKYSLIIPCFNEAKNLELLFERLKKFKDVSIEIEIIIVNNGSIDNSKKILENLVKNYQFVKIVNVKKNQGYGYGILSGLKSASGDVLGWTHADLQTDPLDVLTSIKFFEKSPYPEKIFVKGLRKGRSFTSVFFTVGMAFFEIILLNKIMWDINAQPTMFHRNFFETWTLPPKDFSLDLFAYYMAKKNKLIINRFNVYFGKRAYGVSHWNVGLASKYRFIKRTLTYSFSLKKRIKDNG
tara:strand:+ start:3241 stop:3954 length:714 start_codon:yes stop_codon:yes gene_type:complete